MTNRFMTFLALGAAAVAMIAVTLTPASAQLAGRGKLSPEKLKGGPKGAKGGKGGKGGGKAVEAGPTERLGNVAINQPDFGGTGTWSVPYVTNMSDYITAGWLETCNAFPNHDGDEVASCAPFTPLGKEVFAERRRSDSATDPEGRCLPPGVPRMMFTPYPMKIIQEPNFVTFIFEGGTHVWRQIPVGPKGSLSHEPDPNPTYLGDAIGWWEGDTLVVDTIGFNERTWLDFAGHPHGEKLHVVERYTRLNSRTLEYVATIEDPEYYTQPWTVTLTTNYQPTNKLLEYICQENELDSAHNEEYLRKLGIDPSKIR